MPAIAIVDDRESDRETIGRVVRSVLKTLKEDQVWSVVLDDPPARERDILHWLDEHDATVLVTDWKLNEGAKGDRVVNYEADRLIREIRRKRPTFPIFVITGFEAEARVYLSEVENVFNRKNFTKDASTVIPQILRAGLRRYQEQRELLTRMDTLARQVAIGAATDGEREELKSLEGFFQVELPTIVTLDTVLADLEEVTKRADTLRRKVEKRVKSAKSKPSS